MAEIKEGTKITDLKIETRASSHLCEVVIRGPTKTALCNAAKWVLLKSVGAGRHRAFEKVAADTRGLYLKLRALKSGEDFGSGDVGASGTIESMLRKHELEAAREASRKAEAAHANEMLKKTDHAKLLEKAYFKYAKTRVHKYRSRQQRWRIGRARGPRRFCGVWRYQVARDEVGGARPRQACTDRGKTKIIFTETMTPRN